LNTAFEITALSASHDRASFVCGVSALERYFQLQVTQDVKRKVTSCFVAYVKNEPSRVSGFYTLAATSILLADLPEIVLKKLPRYPSVPAIRMGRLAVDTRFKNQKLGATLLLNALRRAAQTEIAAYALVVDAKDDAAARFYEHHGFQTMSHDPLALFFPLAQCP
jgi:ribosomal protein S18 acetylase RimI-like enzyme